MGLQVARGHAGDVRRCHRRAVDRVRRRVAPDPCGLDRTAGREQVEAGAVVREPGARVGVVDRPDRDRQRCTRGRIIAGVVVVVARRDDDGDATGAVEVRDRGVDRGVGRPAEAHVHDGRRHVVGRDPVHPGDDTGQRAVAQAIQHPDRMQGDGLGDAVRRAAQRAGHVRAVAVAVVDATADVVDARPDTADEFVVRDVQAGVDHVSVDAAAGRVVRVPRVQRQQAPIDAIESPCRTGLDGVDRDRAILFHVGDARIGEQCGQRLVVGLHHEAAQHAIETAHEVGAMLRGDGPGSDRDTIRSAGFGCQAGGLRFEDDDVLAGDGFGDGAEFAGESRQDGAQERGTDGNGERVRMKSHSTFLVHGVMAMRADRPGEGGSCNVKQRRFRKRPVLASHGVIRGPSLLLHRVSGQRAEESAFCTMRMTYACASKMAFRPMTRSLVQRFLSCVHASGMHTHMHACDIACATVSCTEILRIASRRASIARARLSRAEACRVESVAGSRPR